MLQKLQTKSGLIVTGIVTILSAIIVYLLCARHRFYDTDLWIHVLGLEIFGSLILIIGAWKQSYKLLVPYLLTSVFFVYLLIYGAVYSITDITAMRSCIILIASLGIIAFQCCALYSVQKAFEEMRNDVPPAYHEYAAKAWQAKV